MIMTNSIRLRALALTMGLMTALAGGLAGTDALAQGAQIAFSGLKQDTSLPVEVTADQLQIRQADGQATFSGNVVVGQGKMRMTAAKVLVEYAATGSDATGKISRLHATGGVTLVTGAAEAAESQEAVYTIDSGTVVMTGNVVLTQGQNALSGEKLVVDLKTGTGTMQGRVKTILQSGGTKP